VQPLPAFDTAAKDGNAVAGQGPWQLSAGAVRADAVQAPGGLAAGEAVKNSTGAHVPCGAEPVLPLEHAIRAGARLRGPAPTAGKHIRRAGEDAPADACRSARDQRLPPRSGRAYW
jgi:molybdopterin molybdotransferase